MSKNLRFRIGGTLIALVVATILVWQLLPTGKAQETRKLSPEDAKDLKAAPVVTNDPDEILLNAGTVNVKVEKMRRNAADFSKSDGNRLHLVRFNGPIKSAWIDSLKRERLTVVDYIPHYTYLVWGGATAIQRVQGLAKNTASPIEWEGPYKPGYRIMPGVYLNKKEPAEGLSTDQFEIQLFKNDFTNDQTFKVIESLRTTDIVGRQNVKHYVNFVVGLDAEGLRRVSELPDVISIHPYIEPRKYDERQNFILRGNLSGNDPTPGDWLAYLASRGFTQAQFDASNFVVDVSDSGVGNGNAASENQFLLRREGDPAQASRVAYSRLEGSANPGSTLAGCDGHGNINATIIGGYVPTGGIFAAAPHADAMGYRYGLGVAPYVKVGSSVIFDPDTFTSPNLPNLQARAYNDGARITSNSWGADVGGAYTSSSQTFDVLVRDAQLGTSVHPTAGNQQMVVVFSAGNAGPASRTIGAPGTAKNVITVGASENVHPFLGSDGCGITDTGANSANDVIAFSSRGPTTDGRKKPDIQAPGTHITGGAAQNVASNPIMGNGTALTCFNASGVCGGVGSDFFPSGQQWYTTSSGTSHSAPAISGVAALIRQHFINVAPTLASTGGAGTPPSPAMTKALMMNTATYMNGIGANDHLFSNSQGMGLADLDNYFDVFAQGNILSDQESSETFTDTGQERVYFGSVVDSGKPFRITIAYSDAPGPTTGNAFVNDLDLEVVVGGNTYKGNVFSAGDSIPGGTADMRNNVESIFLPAGVSGNFLIRIKATNIAGDGLPGNADVTDQDFALVVWNGAEAAVPVVSAGASSISAESCSLNGAIDPTETVTVDFALSNIGSANITDLVATLLSTGGVSSPSDPQNYGALTTGAGPVSRPFTFTATTNCGEELVASLQLQDGATNLGVVTFTFRTGALTVPAAASASTGNIALSIVDNNTIEIPIEVTAAGELSDLNVKVRLNHTFDSDLVISITSPEGITVPLAAGRGADANDFGSGTNDCAGTFTIFDDAAGTSISGGTAPFAGVFRPESPLSALNGQSINGTWIVSVTDTASGDQGTVGCVQLEMQRQNVYCCGFKGSTPQPVSGGAPVLVSESFVPKNNVPDPGETVTFNFLIANGGDGSTSNLVATLQNSGGVTPVTTSRNYGAVVPAAAPVSRSFTFVANGACGGMVTATFNLQDGGTNYGTISYTFQLGVTAANSQTFGNPAALSIPGAGSSGTALPYPSTITVAGAPTTVTSVKVTLTGLSHTFPADIDVLLVSPTGRKFVLLSDTGSGTDAVNANLTFDDAAGSTPVAPIVTGTFKPADTTSAPPDAFAAPAPAGPYLTPAPTGTETLTSAFTGLAGGDPNGTWSLYIVDDEGGDLGSLSGGWSINLIQEATVCSTTPGAPTRATRADFDGDGRTDLSIWRPSTGDWWVNRSTDGIGGLNWGLNGDRPFSGDFSGDKESDFGIFRGSIDTGFPDFWLLNTPSLTHEAFSWGLPGDIPFSGDYNGDQNSDVAVYRNSENIFYIWIRGAVPEERVFLFGLPGDIPLSGDFDGDGTTDVATYRPSTGTWYFADAIGNPAANVTGAQFGLATDRPVPADYDDDGKDDLAVFRPSTGEWFIYYSETLTLGYAQWGIATDIPVPGDYDGDGRYDIAVYRNGEWWILASTAGPQVGVWGLSTDIPIPATYFGTTP